MINLLKLTDDTTQILAVINQYFDALYHCDCQKITTIFHPEARYINSNENDYMNYSLQHYLTILNDREPPAKSNQNRKEEILAVNFSNNSMATVRLSMQMMQRSYCDFLTLIKHNGQWLIICKVFSFTQQPADT